MFFQKYKRILFILGFIALVCLFGYLIWRMFFAPMISPTTPSEQSNQQSGGLPKAGEGQGQIVEPTTTSNITSGENKPSTDIIFPTEPGTNITTNTPTTEASPVANGGLTQTVAINNDPSFKVTLGNDGKQLQFYNQKDGKFYKIDENGKTTALSDKTFYNVSNVEWSPSKSKAVVEYPDGTKTVYNFDSEKQVTLPKHWENFKFSPDSNKLVMKNMSDTAENRYLIVANDDGSQVKAVEYIGNYAKDAYPSWSPNKQTVAMYTKGVDFNRQDVYFVGLNDENFKSTTIEGRGFTPQWSPQGDKLLYSVYNSSNDLKPKLWIVNAQGDSIGQNRQNLELETWANKCNFTNNSTVYCAVPKELPAASGLIKDLADQTSDYLYKIDVNTGEKKLIAIPEGEHNISDLVVQSGEDKLFFTDKKTGQIYKINLK
ncbi:MAG: hypothetical protein MUF50_03790 [Planctomycetes bacterium]|nr:hypothetical protein [Planctomycetota bacterium]